MIDVGDGDKCCSFLYTIKKKIKNDKLKCFSIQPELEWQNFIIQFLRVWISTEDCIDCILQLDQIITALLYLFFRYVYANFAVGRKMGYV